MLKEIDPDGDLLITLIPSAEPFADESLFDAESGVDNGSEASVFETEPDPNGDRLMSEPDDASATEIEEIAEPLAPTFQFKVSSRNMASASRRFKKMLLGGWLEATTIHADGLRHVDMEGFDPDAFAIVMYLIHGLNKKEQVPREVGLEMLAKIAVITDDLGCYDAVALASEIWLQALGDTLDAATETYDRTMIVSMLIANVFADRSRFRLYVEQAVWESTGPIPTMGLPIPRKVVDTISASREDLIDTAIKRLDDLLESLMGGSECYPACQCMLVGSLTLAIRNLGLGPHPQRPYVGQSLNALVKSMGKIQTPKWSTPGCAHSHNCNISRSIAEIVAGLLMFSPAEFGDLFPTHPLLSL